MPGARREVESIAEAYKQCPLASCTLLIEQDATCDAVLSFLETEDYDIVHFAGHAWYDQEEAYLMCHGHELIRARELQSFLSRRRPPVVFLNSHYTAFVPPGVRERDKDPTSALHSGVIGSSRPARGACEDSLVRHWPLESGFSPVASGHRPMREVRCSASSSTRPCSRRSRLHRPSSKRAAKPSREDRSKEIHRRWFTPSAASRISPCHQPLIYLRNYPRTGGIPFAERSL